MAFFSVIIPSFNRRILLARTLESVRLQRHTDFEVIVVDDGSTDEAGEPVVPRDARIRVIHQEHLGPGASRNRGAESASGEYLAFLDSDDLWFPWSLEVFRTLIARYDRPALLCGNYQHFADESELARVREEPARAEYFADYLASWQRHRVVGAGMIVVRRDTFAAVGGFTTEPCNLEDHDLALRLGDARGFVQLATVTLGWRRHPGNTSHAMSRNVAGCQRLLREERAGRYPGGEAQAAARREIITQHTRSTSLECARAGWLAAAWRIYRATLDWHVALGRWKYLTTFPLYLAAAAVWRLRPSPRPEPLP